tara:strand:- start:192 stop:293 length:102 start_codon:yes stop_codon:yes gene_type:complete
MNFYLKIIKKNYFLIFIDLKKANKYLNNSPVGL